MFAIQHRKNPTNRNEDIVRRIEAVQVFTDSTGSALREMNQ